MKKRDDFNKYEKKLFDFLRSSQHSHVEIFLFGSRARSDHHKASDIDIAFKNIDKKTFFEIEAKIDDLNIPYHVDLVRLDDASDELVQQCIQEGINIQDV